MEGARRRRAEDSPGSRDYTVPDSHASRAGTYLADLTVKVDPTVSGSLISKLLPGFDGLLFLLLSLTASLSPFNHTDLH